MIYKKVSSVHVKFVCSLAVFAALFSCVVGSKRSDESAYIEQKEYVPSRTYYPKEYHPYVQPYSQYYSNPYGRPPHSYYPYYDSDQYYVPPPNYYGYEQDNSTHGDFSGPSKNTGGAGGKY